MMLFIIIFSILFFIASAVLIMKLLNKTNPTTTTTTRPKTTLQPKTTFQPATTFQPTTTFQLIQNQCNSHGTLINGVCICDKNTLNLPIYSEEPLDKCKTPMSLGFVYQLKSPEESKDPFVNDGNGPPLSIDNTNPLMFYPDYSIVIYPYSNNITIKNVLLNMNTTRFLDKLTKAPTIFNTDTIWTMDNYLIIQSIFNNSPTINCSFDVYQKNVLSHTYNLSITDSSTFSLNMAIVQDDSSVNNFQRNVGNTPNFYKKHILYINEDLI